MLPTEVSTTYQNVSEGDFKEEDPSNGVTVENDAITVSNNLERKEQEQRYERKSIGGIGLAFSDSYRVGSSSSIEKTENIIGALRVESDLRQIGGFLIILGIGASYSTFALKSAIVDAERDIDETIQGYRLPLLVSLVLQTFSGLFSMAIGFIFLLVTPTPFSSSSTTNQFVHRLSKALVVIVNCGFITIVLSLLRLYQGAMAGPLSEVSPIVPMSFDPTREDVLFVAAMGALSILSVCSTLIGGLTILSLNLCAYLGKLPIDKNKGYYMFRYAYYCLLTLFGGLSQFSLGAYVWYRFGTGPYNDSIHVAVYTVIFPQLSILVGVVQILHGAYGYGRAMGWFSMGGRDDNAFMHASLFMWITTMAFQIIVQNIFDDSIERNSEAATISAVYMGYFVMPPYLDYLARTTSVRIDPKYFGLPPETQANIDIFSKFFGFSKPIATPQ